MGEQLEFPFMKTKKSEDKQEEDDERTEES